MYIQYVFFSFFKTTSPNIGICGYNNRDNYTPSYLHVALSDSYKAFLYQQKADKRDTEHSNFYNNEDRYDNAGHLARSPPPHSSR